MCIAKKTKTSANLRQRSKKKDILCKLCDRGRTIASTLAKFAMSGAGDKFKHYMISMLL
jgi:hypothetical protein